MWLNRLWKVRKAAPSTMVRARIGYLADGSSRPRADRIEPERSIVPFVNRELPIHDMRYAADPASLSGEGFMLVQHESRVADFTDAAEVEEVYLAEVEELVRQASGATRVFALPRPVLRSSRHAPDATGMITEVPAPIAHTDFTDRSIQAAAAAALERAGATGAGTDRVMIYTVWRSLRPPPQDRPLALCDIRTVAMTDLVRADAVGNPGSAEVESEFYLLKASSRHRWCYYSAMTPDEALIFRQSDSVSDGPSGCPHTSFIHPESQGAVPRLSIEVRACVFLD
ncbi:MAG: CmcJ/NvfI family oxidoreductase [Pseudomonadota bacterium]